LHFYISQIFISFSNTNSEQIKKLASDYSLSGSINNENKKQLITRYIFDFLIKNAASIEGKVQNFPNS